MSVVPVAPALVVIPCLNEAAHIGPLLRQLQAEADTVPMRIVVADGGSTDGTLDTVRRLAQRDNRITLMHNPHRLQSAGVNLAVERFGDGAQHLIRVDAHAHYPPHYCTTLLNEAARTGADSVVVSMNTVGRGTFQRGVAAAQNSLLGTGNAAHRIGAGGRYVDHGHHALMRLGAFRAVGGYDPTFSHNEDAELDHRLRRVGYRIWLTDRAPVGYIPRSTPRALFRQYWRYGQGRARTLLKHRMRPHLRQAAPLAVAPTTVVALGAVAAMPFAGGVSLAFAVPAAAWLCACLAGGIALGVRHQSLAAALAGPAAITMHLAWSLGALRTFAGAIGGKAA